ncbi:Hypothetical predicted protein [Olea europaea subsp. europaea]|uniref:Uncharacterized protein n=1 Tax=Olea europaea subsp. europaea TaxID=158383 RepID=A0A8S0PR26_OLEEU|nr:Hypothetical predicted protein [Olea europaea subsp. europaea]
MQGLNPSFLTSQKNFGQWDLMDQEDQGVAGVVDLWYRVFSWSRWVHWWVFQWNTLGDFFLTVLAGLDLFALLPSNGNSDTLPAFTAV